MRYNCICDIGCVRKNNEDIAYAAGKLVRDGACSGETDMPVAFAVADGMGGYEGGEIASEIVTRSFAAFMKSFQSRDEYADITTLKRWAENANRLVLDTADIRPELSEMGTTFVGLIFLADKIWLINVGDSRCYRFRNGVLRQMSVDHSERERTGDPDTPSNLIYNFMGNLPKEFFFDVNRLEPLPGDIYMLCSDGLSDLVDEDAIESNIANSQALVALAKETGGRDNITIITIQL